MSMRQRWAVRTSLVLLSPVVFACTDPAAISPLQPEAPRASAGGTSEELGYDSGTLAEYSQNWANIYGPLSLAAGGSRNVSSNGEFTVSAVPFQVGADFSVYDHLKYIAISTRDFRVPNSGSLTISVRMDASTPGTQAGRVVHGCYGAPMSFTSVTDACAAPWSSTPLEGQQAGVVLNMINFATGQLFDWFLSDHQIFALVERLPSNVTNPMLMPGDPGYVGLDKAYTQIVKVADVKPGKKYDVAIRYTRSHAMNRVEFFLDNKLFATVDHVGVPLDVQGVPYTGISPALGPGEDLSGQLDSFVIGHGLFSLLDAFPYQHPERPDLSVSIPMSERLFGQGATGTFTKFKVTTVVD